MRSVWRRCSDELPEGGWLVINSAGKIMQETPEGAHVQYGGDVESLIDVGARIRRARVRSGLSQTELGDRLGVSQSMVRHWESSDSHPTDETLGRIRRALDSGLGNRDAGVAAFDAGAALRPQGRMLRTKAGFRRLRIQVGFTQVALAAAVGIKSGMQHGTIDAIVKDWENPGSPREIPEKVWEFLFAMRKRQRDDAAKYVEALVQMHHDVSAPIELTYYRTQPQYEKYSKRSGDCGVYDAMIRLVGDGLEKRGYAVRYVYPEKDIPEATETMEEAMERMGR